MKATSEVRNLIQECWAHVLARLAVRPHLADLRRPEQQLLFEFATGLRRAVRHTAESPSWDGLVVDGLAMTDFLDVEPPLQGAPILLRTEGLLATEAGQLAAGDIALAIHVLRAAPELLDFDEAGCPRHQLWTPTPMAVQGRLLEQRVAWCEAISEAGHEAWLGVVYFSVSGRRTGVESRQIASWASWQNITPTTLASSRRFRSRSSSPSRPSR
jgi:hypothetical protein